MIKNTLINDGTDSCVVYGQSDYAARMVNYLQSDRPNYQIILIDFLLEEENPNHYSLNLSGRDNELMHLRLDTPIYLCFAAKHILHAKNHLALKGFKDIRLYDSLMDNVMKKSFWRKYFSERKLKFTDIYTVPETKQDSKATVCVYRAQSTADKALSMDANEQLAYVVPIQAGAALTDKRIALTLDSGGDNISERNPRYSEMTVFYWMWKNSTADYVGICHYRRLWVNLEFIVKKLRTTDVAVVLPLPTLCEKSVHDDYLLKYIPDVWKPMMDVLREQSPEYYDAAQKIFAEPIFYASNMCILRRDVLDDLCSWMFPIVMEVEQRVGDLPDPYYNRYAGFCTERLITLYFRYNKHNWSIAHAEKIFIGE